MCKCGSTPSSTTPNSHSVGIPWELGRCELGVGADLMADVLLIGLGGTTLSALESLSAHVNVVGVVRRPDGADDPVLSVAARGGIPVFSDTSISAIAALVESL